LSTQMCYHTTIVATYRALGTVQSRVRLSLSIREIILDLVPMI
jgi:hypothetical protein